MSLLSWAGAVLLMFGSAIVFYAVMQSDLAGEPVAGRTANKHEPVEPEYRQAA